MTEDPAAATRSRLRESLRAAMLARHTQEAQVLRSLLAAVDNAQAVPTGEAGGRYVPRAFGDGSAEVPRLVLSAEDLRRLFRREIEERRAAAEELRRHGRADRADALIAEADIIAHHSGEE